MAKLAAQDHDADFLEAFLAKAGHNHLRVRRRADLLTIESGPTNNPHQHARFRRVTVQYWRLEMPNRSGKWDLTPFRGLLAEVQELLVDSFPWTIAPLE
jgi:hypothetical protein